ncbi:hypothetical protein KJ644_05060 [Candidatus Dependentiae bacterium]|nr:hypothetical protein [Candidatus Dependentiae bacterium]
MELKMKVFAGWMDRDSGLFIPKENGAVGDGFDTEPIFDEVVCDLVNLTPHPCVIFDDAGEEEIARIAPSGQVARVQTLAIPEREDFVIDGHYVPVVATSYGEVENLPVPKDGTIYIVSVLVVTAFRMKGVTRTDVLAPDTGPESVVRDGEGRIMGVRRFTR